MSASSTPIRVVFLNDIESHCNKVAALVRGVRRDDYLRSGGSWAGACNRTSSMKDMALCLDATAKQGAGVKTLAAKHSNGVPSLGRRGDLFSKSTSRPGKEPFEKSSPRSLDGVTAKERILSQLRSKASALSSSKATDSSFPANTKSCARVPKASSSLPRYERYLRSITDDSFKKQCGMMQFMWQKDSHAKEDEEEPIGARFKKFYKDFIVTEIPMQKFDASPELPLPRIERNFSIPPPPPHLVELLGMPTTQDNIFAPVEKSAQLKAAMSMKELKGDVEVLKQTPTYSNVAELVTGQASSDPSTVLHTNAGKGLCGRRRFFVQAVMRKKRLPHSIAMKLISSALSIKPERISVAGVKDYVADTVQHVRIEGVSPSQLLEANAHFRKVGARISFSDFSYHEEPLSLGDLHGNHFKILLRAVSPSHVDRMRRNMERVSTVGCLNYYGSQRFSHFAGREDPMLAIMSDNWLLFAFRFLNFTDNPNISLTALLQRPLRYPTLAQNQYRHAVIKRLRMLRIEPTVLDKISVFRQTPRSYEDKIMHLKQSSDMSRIGLIHDSLRSAFFDIAEPDRLMSVQMMCSFYWNIALATRFDTFGAVAMVGDMINMKAVRARLIAEAGCDAQRLKEIELHFPENSFVKGWVTEKNKHLVSPHDILLPSFTLHNGVLPKNETSDIYQSVCDRFALSWDHKVPALRHFMKAHDRPMLVRPTQMSMDTSPLRSDGTTDVTLSFALTKGSYASVVLADVLSLPHCVGQEDTTLRPLPYATEWDNGRVDSQHVRTMASLYNDPKGSGLGSTDEQTQNDSDASRVELPESAASSAASAYAHSETDGTDAIIKWSEYHLVRNGLRILQVDKERRENLFGEALSREMNFGEVDRYIGDHPVPSRGNSNVRSIRKALRKRKIFKSFVDRNIGNGPAPEGGGRGNRVARRAQKKSFINRPSYALQNVGTWNWK